MKIEIKYTLEYDSDMTIEDKKELLKSVDNAADCAIFEFSSPLKTPDRINYEVKEIK